MNNPTRVLALALIATAALLGTARAQTSTLDFNVPGPAPWATDTNWDPIFVPGDTFPAEIPGVSNGGTVTLSSPAPFDVNGVVLGESGHPIAAPVGIGTMQISAGGALNLVPAASQDGTIPAVGTFRIGANGTGRLEMTGGVLNVTNAMTLAGAVDSTLALSGNASLSVGSANLQRTTRIRGPNVSFESAGNVNIGGTFVAEITGATHSMIDAFGASANVGGTMRAEFSGFAPAVGASWTLLQAANISGNFQNLELSGVTPVPGGKFEVVNDGDTLSLNYINALTLSVDRRTGIAQVVNHIGSISFDGYTISDTLGNLNPAAWSSLDEQGVGGNSWLEANPSNNRLNELNPTASRTLAAGGFNELGNILLPPSEFGQPDPNLTFQYHTPGGRTVTGIVELSGPRNNIVMIVDPSTGQAALQNQSPFDVRLDGYTIASASGSLRLAQWNSLDDQNVEGGTFLEANPSTNRISELNPTSDLLLPKNSTARLLGSPFNPAATTRDLSFRFHLAGGGDGPLGDTNDDGLVDIVDLNNVRNNFGATGLGDTDGNGIIDIVDLNNVRNNFGATGGGGGPGGSFTGIVLYQAIPAGIANAVPEPASALLLVIGIAARGLLLKRKRCTIER